MVPFKSKLDCSHGYFANCPVHSYNCPEEEMRGMAIAAEVACRCDYYCANWPNCRGGKFKGSK